MRAKKSYGQHFLTAPLICERIAAEINLACQQHHTGNVLEIGPGTGMLTRHLTNTVDRLKAVEADPDMVAFLRSRKSGLSGLDIVEADFLSLDIALCFEGLPFIVAGNFPYSISSQIVFRVLENRKIVPAMVGMFQKEVALRICAQPRSKDYGILSVLTRAFYHPTYLFELGPEYFDPPPKVNSAVIRLDRNTDQLLPCDEGMFRSVVKTAFNQRRKMLRNSLKAMSLERFPELATYMTMRPEMLSVDDFVMITAKLQYSGNPE